MSQGKTPPGKSVAIDAALAAWPSPERSTVEWDESAERLTKRARLKDVAGPMRSQALLSDDALLAPPELTPEPDEGAAKADPIFGGPPSSRDRDKANLRDLAKLAYLTPSVGHGSSPKVPVAPAMEARAPGEKEDSGLVHLAQLAAADPAEAASLAMLAPPAPVSAPALPPAKSDPAVAPAAVAPVVPIGRHTSGAPRKSGPWVTVFAMTTAAAVTAAVFLGFDRDKAATAPLGASTPVAAASVAAVTPAMATAPRRLPSSTSSSADGVVDPSTLPLAVDSVTSHSAAHGLVSKVAMTSPVTEAPPSPPAVVAAAPPPPPPPAASGADLQTLMQQAAGETAKAAPSEAPAAASPTAVPGSVPLKPSQGAIQGALGAALPGARRCLGEDDAIAHATVTFKSDGSVESVSVSGSASGKPAEGCIRSALMHAKVSPFAQPTFTASVTVRPN